jgi:CDP-diacylglycerol--glycerol-3-phosphate 3-phosphatidyltransferase
VDKLSVTRDWLKHLPNKLTLARIAAIPLLLLIYPFLPSLNVFCAFLFAIAALTDLIDGYLARKYGNVTPLGALLDQVADKMLVAASLVLLANAQVIPAFVAGLLICRDIAVNGIRLMALEQSLKIEVSEFGKWKTTLLSFAIFCLFINERLFNLPFREAGMIMLWGGVALSLWSAWAYASGFLKNTKVSLYS